MGLVISTLQAPQSPNPPPGPVRYPTTPLASNTAGIVTLYRQGNDLRKLLSSHLTMQLRTSSSEASDRDNRQNGAAGVDGRTCKPRHVPIDPWATDNQDCGCDANPQRGRFRRLRYNRLLSLVGTSRHPGIWRKTT
jgi:hypothetical protein